MPANINRQPAGAIELLDLNLQGEFPRSLDLNVSPSVEMSPFYYAGHGIDQVQLSQNVNTINVAWRIPVPSGENWAVRGVDLRCENLEAAAAGFQASIRFRSPSNVPCLVGPLTPQFTVLPNQFYETGLTFQDPIILTPGFSIEGLSNVYTGIPVNGFSCTLSVIFHRLNLT